MWFCFHGRKTFQRFLKRKQTFRGVESSTHGKICTKSQCCMAVVGIFRKTLRVRIEILEKFMEFFNFFLRKHRKAFKVLRLTNKKLKIYFNLAEFSIKHCILQVSYSLRSLIRFCYINFFVYFYRIFIFLLLLTWYTIHRRFPPLNSWFIFFTITHLRFLWALCLVRWHFLSTKIINLTFFSTWLKLKLNLQR